jgi:AAA+ superfamily predicted ATPase
MDDQHAVIASLRNAVAALPDDLALRMHLAGLLLQAGERDEAVGHLGAVLQADPGHAGALAMLVSRHEKDGAKVAGPPEPGAGAPPRSAPPPPAAGLPGTDRPESAASPEPGRQPDPAPKPLLPRPPGDDVAGAGPAGGAADAGTGEFNWAQAEAELSDVLPPMFITPDGSAAPASGGLDGDSPGGAGAFDTEQPGLRLADVAGLAEVKARLEAAFLAPMRNPELRRLYGKSLRGGLLLYGPPGCGKTFIARAVAGELGARFMSVSFADVVDMYIGSSERNIKELFDNARQNAPCVIFLDEVDAIGQKRSQLRSAPMRSAVNQLLLELDDVAGGNEGVFVLAATNHPWDVDSALRRPGRLDRTLLVLPPDEQAREAVFRYHLRGRPVAGIELTNLAARTDGYSAADIAHVCESAAELALLDSASSGQVRMIGQHDLVAATGQVRPSLGSWFESARNVALFANEGGSYDDLAAYLKKRKLL